MEKTTFVSRFWVNSQNQLMMQKVTFRLKWSEDHGGGYIVKGVEEHKPEPVVVDKE